MVEKFIQKVVPLSICDFKVKSKLYSLQTLFTISKPIPKPPSMLFPLYIF